MHISEIYKSIYRFWGDTTPLYGDCGQLCGKACCKSDPSDDDETGMYLFPGEETLYEKNKNFRIVSSDFDYGNKKFAKIAICNGPCVRDLRPLSCRILPLIPYYKNGKLTVIQDPRAKHMCPLAQKKALAYLDPVFHRKTEQTFRLLLQFSETRSFLEGLTEILDECLKFDPTEEWI